MNDEKFLIPSYYFFVEEGNHLFFFYFSSDHHFLTLKLRKGLSLVKDKEGKVFLSAKTTEGFNFLLPTEVIFEIFNQKKNTKNDEDFNFWIVVSKFPPPTELLKAYYVNFSLSSLETAKLVGFLTAITH